MSLTLGLHYLDFIINEKYIKFSSELWINKPYVRQAMYESLKDDIKFKTYDKTAVINILGVADEELSNALVYNTSPGRILIIFDDGFVSDIQYETPLD